MKRKSIPRIITNRQLNFTLSPVDTYNKKEMPYNLQNYCIDGTWNQHQSIILDCILDRLFHAMYKDYNKPPQSWRSKKTIETINSYLGETVNPEALNWVGKPPYEAFVEHKGEDLFRKIKKDYKQDKGSPIAKGNFKQYLDRWHARELYQYRVLSKKVININKVLYGDADIRCNIIDLLEGYPFLMRYKYSLAEQLIRIGSTKFKMNYKVKYIEKIPVYGEDGKMTERGRLVDMHYEMQEFQNIFNISFEDDKIVFNFNTPLGKLIIYNMLILDTDWIPVDVCKLSKNSYFLYKRFLLSKRSGKFKAKKIELKFEDIKSFLDLQWGNDSGIHTIIEKALNDMKKNGLIHRFECKNPFKRRVYELYFEEIKQTPEKQEDDDRKVLKMIA